MILRGKAPVGLVSDSLVIVGRDEVFSLPNGLRVRDVTIMRCSGLRDLPPDLFAGNVHIVDCSNFSSMPASVRIKSFQIDGCQGVETLASGLHLENVSINHCPNLKGLTGSFRFWNLRMPGSYLETLSADLAVRGTLDLRDSKHLISLPDGLRVGKELILKGCTALENLPQVLEVDTLDLSGCTGLRFRDLGDIETRHLDVSDCVQLTELPEWIWVWESIDVANTGLTGLPPSLSHCQILWRGVPIQERIAFDPETLTVTEILGARNTEQRRVMMERMGWEAFLAHVPSVVLDRDEDPGGERKLLGFTFDDGEETQILVVCCPSTGRRYFIRVPPRTKTCQEAAAWIAGFDIVDEYEPVMET